MANDISKGAMPRWQQNELNRSFGNQNATKIFGPAQSTALATANLATASIKPELQRSPVNFHGKSPGACGTVQGTSKMSNGGGGGGISGDDRFIPNRTASNFNSNHYKVTAPQQIDGDGKEHNQNYRNTLSAAMQLNVGGDRLFSYQAKRPLQFIENKLPTQVATNSRSRYISTTSERMLDAPEINNNFYLNLMDWGASTNTIALALGKTIYGWNAETADILQLCEYETIDDACSLAWIQQGKTLAIGLNDGTIELWDVEAKKRLRTMDGHAERVGSLAWNSFVLTSGSLDRSIIHHDVRVRDHAIATLSGHAEEVCGLKYSTDFKYLASGGNDNKVNVWPIIAGSNANKNEAIYQFDQHRAAVRAIAWCPWQTNLLATGGGTADRTIKFWNINNGQLIDSIDAKSQVSAVLWSKTYREIISAHSYPGFQLTIWKYPSLQTVCQLAGHEARIIQLAMSPDGSTVASASADETIRIWKCFAPDKREANKKKPALKIQPSLVRPNMR